MSLRIGMTVGLCAVAALAFLVTVIWSMADAHDRGERQLRATLARVSAMVERNRQMLPDEPDAQHARRTTLDVMQVLSPGTCAEIEETRISPRRLCADWQVFGSIAPRWFRGLQADLFGVPQTVTHDGYRNVHDHYRAEVSFDPVAYATNAWGQARIAARQALVMGLGIVALGVGLIFHSTRPVQPIVTELGALGSNRLSARVSPQGFTEFRRIAGAVNMLAERLEQAESGRRTLTRQLLEVEDAERRHLARDLHDEFGQILTATGALAGGIERRVRDADPEIALDAEAIGKNVRRMMETLRGAFARLRPPELEEIGLAASLRQLAGGWAAARGGRVRFEMNLAALNDQEPSPEVALAIYRIVQESVTNAMRHGNPTWVAISLVRKGNKSLELAIEDDGGGRIASASTGRGQGILGISERVEAMSGGLLTRSTERGVRIDVRVPLASAAA